MAAWSVVLIVVLNSFLLAAVRASGDCTTAITKTFPLDNSTAATAALAASLGTNITTSATGAYSSRCGGASDGLYGVALAFTGAGARFVRFQDRPCSTSAQFSFKLRAGDGVLQCEQIDIGDDIALRYSVDGGQSFTVIQTVATPSSPTGWRSFIFTVPVASVGVETVFEIGQASHSGSNFDNWAVADVVLAGFAATAQLCAPLQDTFPQGVALDATLWSGSRGAALLGSGGGGLLFSGADADSRVLESQAFIMCQSSPSIAFTMTRAPGTTTTLPRLMHAYGGGSAWSVALQTDTSPPSLTNTYNVSLEGLYASATTPIRFRFYQSGPLSSNAQVWTLHNVSLVGLRPAPAGHTQCIPNVCVNGGTCTLSTGACACARGYGGTTCATVIPCSSVSDGFETLDSSPIFDRTDGIDGGAVTSTPSCGTFAGASVAEFGGVGTRSAITVALGMCAASPVLSFRLRIGNGLSKGSCEQADTGEGIEVYAGVETSNSWILLDTIPASESSSTFTAYTVSLASFVPSTARFLRLRWEQQSHSSDGYDMWALDSVQVSGASLTMAANEGAVAVCLPNPCPAGQTCASAGGSYVTCNGVFSCSTSSDCSYNGVCSSATKTCSCYSAYTGDRCQYTRPACSCVNGGTCLASGACACTAKYEGDKCQYRRCSTVRDGLGAGAGPLNATFWAEAQGASLAQGRCGDGSSLVFAGAGVRSATTQPFTTCTSAFAVSFEVYLGGDGSTSSAACNHKARTGATTNSGDILVEMSAVGQSTFTTIERVAITSTDPQRATWLLRSKTSLIPSGGAAGVQLRFREEYSSSFLNENVWAIRNVAVQHVTMNGTGSCRSIGSGGCLNGGDCVLEIGGAPPQCVCQSAYVGDDCGERKTEPASPVGTIVGTVIGVMVVICVCAVCGYRFVAARRKYKHREEGQQQQAQPQQEQQPRVVPVQPVVHEQEGRHVELAQWGEPNQPRPQQQQQPEPPPFVAIPSGEGAAAAAAAVATPPVYLNPYPSQRPSVTPVYGVRHAGGDDDDDIKTVGTPAQVSTDSQGYVSTGRVERLDDEMDAPTFDETAFEEPPPYDDAVRDDDPPPAYDAFVALHMSGGVNANSTAREVWAWLEKKPYASMLRKPMFEDVDGAALLRLTLSDLELLVDHRGISSALSADIDLLKQRL